MCESLHVAVTFIMCNGEVGNFVMVYSNDNDTLSECFYKWKSILHEYLLFYCHLTLQCPRSG